MVLSAALLSLWLPLKLVLVFKELAHGQGSPSFDELFLHHKRSCSAAVESRLALLVHFCKLGCAGACAF